MAPAAEGLSASSDGLRLLNRSRQLNKDFEVLPETTEAWIRIAMIQLMIRRLAAKK